MRDSLDFIASDVPDDSGAVDVQLDGSGVTVSFRARDGFYPALVEFVERTRRDPQLRDVSNERGTWTHGPSTELDLSPFFSHAASLRKNGEYDDAYILVLESRPELWVHVDIMGPDLDAFIEEVRSFVG